MPAKSKSQRKLFALVNNYKKGKTKNASKEVKKIAKSISAKDAHDFASTKEKGLPEHKKKDENVNFGKLWNKILHERKEALKREIKEVDSQMYNLHPKYGVPKENLMCRECTRSFAHVIEICTNCGECKACHFKKYEALHPHTCKKPQFISGHEAIEKIIKDYEL